MSSRIKKGDSLATIEPKKESPKEESPKGKSRVIPGKKSTLEITALSRKNTKGDSLATVGVAKGSRKRKTKASRKLRRKTNKRM